MKELTGTEIIESLGLKDEGREGDLVSVTSLVNVLCSIATYDPIDFMADDGGIAHMSDLDNRTRMAIKSFNISKSSFSVQFFNKIDAIKLLDKILDLSRFRDQIISDPKLAFGQNEEEMLKKIKETAEKAGISLGGVAPKIFGGNDE